MPCNVIQQAIKQIDTLIFNRHFAAENDVDLIDNPTEESTIKRLR